MTRSRELARDQPRSAENRQRIAQESPQSRLGFGRMHLEPNQASGSPRAFPLSPDAAIERLRGRRPNSLSSSLGLISVVVLSWKSSKSSKSWKLCDLGDLFLFLFLFPLLALLSLLSAAF